MKACLGTFSSLLWALLCCYCMLYMVHAADDDLLDFDFANLKEIDWDYSDSNSKSNSDMLAAAEAAKKKLTQNLVTFGDDFDEENQVHPFDWRERILRTALSKALTNTGLRQKFVEVMPILRVLSSQQRLALSALISAQVNARQGQELKLEQVRMMFGDDKKLLIPIVYDIANLVRNSARKYLQFDYDIAPSSELKQLQTPISKRTFELTSAETAAEPSVGTKPAYLQTTLDDEASLEDFFVEMPKDVLDPKRINEELQAAIIASTTTSKPKTLVAASTIVTNLTTKSPTIDNDKSKKLKASQRRRRSAQHTEFVHKLIRSIPLSVNEDDLLKGAAGRTMKLNTTAFFIPNENELLRTRPTTTTTIASAAVTMVTPTTTTMLHDVYQQPLPQQQESQPKVLSYQEVEDIAFASLNSSELNLSSNAAPAPEGHEPLPSPEELIAGPRYRTIGNRLRPVHLKSISKRKRVQLRPRAKTPQPQASAQSSVVLPKKCERFTASMCLRADDYPLDQIMGSIRRHKNAMSALLAEYHDKVNDFEARDDFNDFPYNKKRREDEEIDGKSGMCQSIVRYARPQKARSASGEWKYIVNTGQHTQTLRLEKCSNPQESCSYLAQSYRSRCSQVYNYHRLLSWDKTRGLHVDIFKVPTCCSCQIDGYRQQYPPLGNVKAKDYTPVNFNTDLYSTIGDELDYQDDDDDDALDYTHQYAQNYNKQQKHGHSPYDASELLLGSKKVRTKVYPPNPTVGSYLSPPGSEDYANDFSYKRQRAAGSSSSSSYAAAPNNLLHLHQQRSNRRPYKSIINEDRVDLEISPSEKHTDKEVKIYARNSDTTRVQQKRKRIYSVPYTATSTSSASISSSELGSSTTSTITAGTIPAYYTTSGSSSSSNSANNNNVIVGAPHQPVASTTFATTTTNAATSTPSTATAIPPSYHVNSIYSNQYGSGTSAPGASPKRINYSYHPIIDFFENNKRAAAAAAAAAATSTPASTELVYHHSIPNSTPLGVSVPIGRRYQSRGRIGYGAGAGEESSNAWQPVVMES